MSGPFDDEIWGELPDLHELDDAVDPPDDDEISGNVTPRDTVRRTQQRARRVFLSPADELEPN